MVSPPVTRSRRKRTNAGGEEAHRGMGRWSPAAASTSGKETGRSCIAPPFRRRGERHCVAAAVGVQVLVPDERCVGREKPHVAGMCGPRRRQPGEALEFGRRRVFRRGTPAWVVGSNGRGWWRGCGGDGGARRCGGDLEKVGWEAMEALLLSRLVSPRERTRQLIKLDSRHARRHSH
jgi:hypothetical protein